MTVTEAVTNLKARGFNIDFNLAFDKLISSNGIYLDPQEFEIIEVYLFEGETNPSDEDVVYAIESKDKKLKRVLISAFGIYAYAVSNAMIRELEMHTSSLNL